MRQLLNTAYVVWAEGIDAEKYDEWAAKLDAEPGTVPRPKTYVDPALLGMMGPG